MKTKNYTATINIDIVLSAPNDTDAIIMNLTVKNRLFYIMTHLNKLQFNDAIMRADLGDITGD